MIKLYCYIFLITTLTLPFVKTLGKDYSTSTNKSPVVSSKLSDSASFGKTWTKKQKEEALVDLLREYNNVKQDIESENHQIARVKLLQLFDVAKELGDNWWLARLNLDIGLIYYNEGYFDKGLKYFLEAYSLSETRHTSPLQIEAVNYIGKYYHSIGDFNSSLEYFIKALNLAKHRNDTLNIISAMNSLSKHYSTTGDYEMALDYGLSALRMQEGKKLDNEIYATTCNHLGGIYFDLKNWDEALKYHKQALWQRQKKNNTMGMGKSFLNIGRVFMTTGDTDSANYYLHKAEVLFDKLHYSKGKIKTHNALGTIAEEQNDLKSAYSHFSESLRLSEETGYIKGEINSLLGLGNIELDEGSNEKAFEYFNRSLKTSEGFNLKESMAKSYKGLETASERLGRFQEANNYGKKYFALHEKNLKKEYDEKLAKLHMIYVSEQKEKQNQLLIRENQLNTLKLKQKNLVMWFVSSGLFVLIILCLFIFFRYRQKQTANKLLAGLNSELLKVSREKDKFFSIIAHEIRNPLWWFKNITEMLSQKYEEMSREDLSQSLRSLDESAKNTFLLMDNLLHWTQSQLQLLPYKPEVLDLNLVIEQNASLFYSLCFVKNISLIPEYRETPKILADKEQLNTIMRNLISNAVKFTPSGGSIGIHTDIKDNCVVVCVADNGIGIDKTILQHIFSDNFSYSTLGLMQEKGSGIGLKLCKEFVEKNGGKINVFSTQHAGTTIEFSLPLYTPASKPTKTIHSNRNLPHRRIQGKENIFQKLNAN